MIVFVMNIQDPAVGDRFDWGCDIAAQPSWVSGPHTADFRTTAAMVDTGPVTLSVGAGDRQCWCVVAIDLAGAVLAGQVDAAERLPPQTRRQTLVSRIDAFIQSNLGDPDLTPATIAAHHHISLGYLHRIFSSRELTVAAQIRRQRLERCRVDLADPQLRTHPIHVIATRWGFRHAADFTRAFRAAHGVTPSDYRQQAVAKAE